MNEFSCAQLLARINFRQNNGVSPSVQLNFVSTKALLIWSPFLNWSVSLFSSFFVYSLHLRLKPLKLKAQSPNWQDFLFTTMKVKKLYFRFFICFVFLDKLKAATILKVTLFHGCFHVFQIIQMVINCAKRLIWKERESRGVLEIRDGEDLWRWLWLEISLKTPFVGQPYHKNNSSSSLELKAKRSDSKTIYNFKL